MFRKTESLWQNFYINSAAPDPTRIPRYENNVYDAKEEASVLSELPYRSRSYDNPGFLDRVFSTDYDRRKVFMYIVFMRKYYYPHVYIKTLSIVFQMK